MIYLKHSQTPIGPITLMSDGEYLTGLWFDGQKYDRLGVPENEETGGISEDCDLPVFRETEEYLRAYFRGNAPDFQVPVKVEGSPFRTIVSKAMRRIPFGGLVTYGELAREAAKACGRAHMSAQAVGGAVGHNPISVIIPCHRVIGGDGSLTGYAGGIEKKIYLLRNEGHRICEKGGKYYVSDY